jgi:phosphatidylserine/phosphatidylglycerophosphate/cardiolipin synthase-like enzyme
MASRSLIVMPDDTGKPILDAIEAAQESIRIKIFLFSEPTLIAAVIAAHQRGVKVRVMLNPARRSGEPENETTRETLLKAGIEVLDSNPAIDVTHEKSMVVDGKVAFIQSLNWEIRNFTETRDYAIVTTHRHEVDEVVQCFDADWERKPFDPGEDSHLIWCNINGRNRVAKFIDETKETLFLQNERYQDEVIIERLVRAVHRGVKLHILARPAHTLKKGKLVEGVEGLRILQDLGAKVHKLKGLRLHGKMMFADNARALIGSINLAPGSFDSRRELAIAVDDEEVARRLHQVVHHDWEHSTPLDLSDEGLLADLKEVEKEANMELALNHGGHHGHDGHNGHH